MRSVVVNSTPIISLHSIGKLDLLERYPMTQQGDILGPLYTKGRLKQ